MPASRVERSPAHKRARPVLAVLLAFALLSLLWNLPVRLSDVQIAHFGSGAIEVAVLFALLALLATWRRTGRRVAIAAASVTLFVVVLTLADFAVRTALGRPLSPWLDLHMAPSLVHLVTGSLGHVLGWLTLLGFLGLLAAVFALAYAAVTMAQRALAARPARIVTFALSGALLGAFVLQTALPDLLAGYQPATAHASRTLFEQWQRGRATLEQLASFQQAASRDSFADVEREQLLRGLDGVDVLFMFIESYGRSALEDERYAGRIRPRLEAFEAALAGPGLHAASGWLTSPIAGGQSWLAHGTLESGLWLPHQRHYELLLTSDRLTLTKAFRRAGHRTVAFKPAITMPWPEGQRLGFERIYAAADLGYAGLPYNWVTMPDQYTLAVLERAERAQTDRSPLFVQASLISSHAPWVPIPPVLDDWSSIGDGAIFSQWATGDDPPEVVWRDPERVRRQYGLAIDYVLGALASYAERFVDARTLLVLVGDHQPSPLITGEGASRDVPMHVMSSDPELIRPFLEGGFAPGMLPGRDGPVRRMDAFRDWFLGAFGEPRLEAASAGG